MHAFLNPETGQIVSYNDLRMAALQAALVGQKYVVSFEDDKPVVYEFDFDFEGS